MHAANGSSDRPIDAGEALVSVLAHELRTPITTVYAGSILLARHGDLPVGMRRVLAANVREEAARVYRVVEDLLVLARLEYGRLTAIREPVILGRALRAAAQLEAGRWPWLHIRPSVERSLPPVAGDSQAVAHVLRNLIATVGSRTVAGSLEMAAERRGARVACRIVDRTGSLPAASHDTLFELPQQSGDDDHVVGPGIGLYVARELILVMGGTVWTDALDDGCVELGFDLPLYEAA
jgi:two-component system sensor histidine kinase KdpD